MGGQQVLSCVRGQDGGLELTKRLPTILQVRIIEPLQGLNVDHDADLLHDRPAAEVANRHHRNHRVPACGEVETPAVHVVPELLNRGWLRDLCLVSLVFQTLVVVLEGLVNLNGCRFFAPYHLDCVRRVQVVR